MYSSICYFLYLVCFAGHVCLCSKNINSADQTTTSSLHNIQGSQNGFHRISSGGSFKINIPISKKDSFPPSRITDLRIISTDVDTKAVQLQWTAPGDKLDVGRVAYYEVKFAENQTQLLNITLWNEKDLSLFNANISGDFFEPLEAGTLQNATFILEKAVPDVTYFLALRAFSKANKSSPISNIVTVEYGNVSELNYMMIVIPIACIALLIIIIIVACQLFKARQ